MRFAQVVAVHPQRRTVDLVLLDTGLRVAEVHVLSSEVSSDGGEWNFPDVPMPTSEQMAGTLPTTGRQLVVAVDQGGDGRLVVLGFLHPLEGQMVFTQQDREVRRHGASGAYSTTAPDGSIEVYHPSGAYVRMGTGPHEPLAPFAANQNWVETASAPPPTVTLHAAKVDLVIDPAGNISLHTQGKAAIVVDGPLDISSKGALTIHSDSTLGISAKSSVTVTGSNYYWVKLT